RSLPAVINNKGRFHLISMVQINRESHGNSSKKYCSIKFGPVATIGLCEDKSSAAMAKGTELGTPMDQLLTFQHNTNGMRNRSLSLLVVQFVVTWMGHHPLPLHPGRGRTSPIEVHGLGTAQGLHEYGKLCDAHTMGQ